MALTPNRRFILLSLAGLLAGAGLAGACKPDHDSGRPFEVAAGPASSAPGPGRDEVIAETQAASKAALVAVQARKAVPRASRSKTAPRPVVAQTVPQAPTPAPVGCDAWGYKTRSESDACWGPIIASYGDWSVSRMLAILYCESKGNPWVVNASNHVGLLQIKGSNTKGNGPANIAHGHAMWLRSGTAPWRQCGG